MFRYVRAAGRESVPRAEVRLPLVHDKCFFAGRDMALFDLSPRAFRRRGSAAIADSCESDLDAVLIREQYRSLARTAPYFYGAEITAAATLAIAARGASSPLSTVALPGALMTIAVLVMAYWLRVRKRAGSRSLDVMRRDIRLATVFGPALALVLSLIAAVALPQTDDLERSLLVFGIWFATAAGAFCLTRLAHAAVLVVFAASAPLIAALLRGGDGLTFWFAALLLVISCLVIVMLTENYRAFADIVRSRFIIAEKHRAAEDAREAATAIAYSDYLTSLPNRRWIQSLLSSRVEAGGAGGPPFALGLLDLDGFKPINDIHGHPVGDEILKQVADRLAAAMRGRGHAARMGGDEFAILCEGVAAEREALALGRDLKSVFAAPFVVDQLTVHLHCTAGFALFPASGDRADQLIRLADVALYRAKANGPGGVGVFDRTDESAAIARATLEQALHRAVAEDAIAVFFQPIVDLATGRVSGFESLARWTDPRLGAIEPSVFIPVAEQIGLIDELSRDLLRKAATAASRWPGDLSLSFNLSAGQLSKPSVGSDIVAALREFGFAPTRFEIELTETAIMKNLDAARSTIETLRAAGVRVALDDFGAGYSSLAQVRDLALDRIKIDKSFIERLCLDPKIANLTRAIVDMARRLELPCVAEGIESAEQLEELRHGGCAEGQGWLFAHAMPEAMVARFIEERRGAG